jgi:hypothetical protein
VAHRTFIPSTTTAAIGLVASTLLPFSFIHCTRFERLLLALPQLPELIRVLSIMFSARLVLAFALEPI